MERGCIARGVACSAREARATMTRCAASHRSRPLRSSCWRSPRPRCSPRRAAAAPASGRWRERRRRRRWRRRLRREAAAAATAAMATAASSTSSSSSSSRSFVVRDPGGARARAAASSAGRSRSCAGVRARARSATRASARPAPRPPRTIRRSRPTPSRRRRRGCTRDIQRAWSERDDAALERMLGADLLVEWRRRLADFASKGWVNEVAIRRGPEVDVRRPRQPRRAATRIA